jgi:methylenetetrahydrofolate reductase (NADPH)
MRIADLYRAASGPVFSFEFFPPKTPAGWRTLYRTIADLAELRPAFVSVTREELGETLDRLAAAGIHNVMALRGDPPKDQPTWRPVPGGFSFASELAAFVKSRGDFCIGGACYPETHPDAPSPAADVENLKRKLEAGAEFLITQLFLNNAHFFSFVDRARAAGIRVPIVPGIMPLVSLANLRGALKNAPNSDIPRELERGLEEAGEDKERGLEVGVAWATLQCQELLARGAPGIHFLTMNHSPATRRVHANLTGEAR